MKKYIKHHYEIKEGTAYVYGKNDIVFLIDEADLELLRESFIRWIPFYNKSAEAYYMHGVIDRKTTYLHRYLMGLKPGDKQQVDHINHDPLDNRRANLRLVNDGQNKQNRGKLDKRNKSGVRGVFWSKQKNKWQAKLAFKNKPQMHVGFFDSLEEAESAVKEARRKHMPFSVESTSDESFTDLDLNKTGWERKSKSGVKGVCWNKQTEKWMAIFQRDGKSIYVGSFDTVAEAKTAIENAREMRTEDIPKAVHPRIANSMSGIRGVNWDGDRGKWQARFKGKHLGRFNTIEEAEAAIKEANEI